MPKFGPTVPIYWSNWRAAHIYPNAGGSRSVRAVRGLSEGRGAGQSRLMRCRPLYSPLAFLAAHHRSGECESSPIGLCGINGRPWDLSWLLMTSAVTNRPGLRRSTNRPRLRRSINPHNQAQPRPTPCLSQPQPLASVIFRHLPRQHISQLYVAHCHALPASQSARLAGDSGGRRDE